MGYWSDFYCDNDENWDVGYCSDGYSYDWDYDYDDTEREETSDLYAYEKDWDYSYSFADNFSDCYAYEVDSDHDDTSAEDSSGSEEDSATVESSDTIDNVKAKIKDKEAVVVPEETVNITEPLSSKDGNQAAAADEGTDLDGSFEEDVDSDDASSLVLNDSARNGKSLDQVKCLEDASQTVENGDTGLNTVASITETANNLLTEEVQPAKETVQVNGFDVFSSQVESVSHIFKRHPDIALTFRPKNQQIRRAYMKELLNLIEMLCQSPEKLSEDDLSNADDTLADLIDVGFKLDWLKTKLNEVSEKKKKEQSSGARLQTMEEQMQTLKLMFLDLETQLQMEKKVALAARAPLSFNDVVC